MAKNLILDTILARLAQTYTAWKVPKYGVISGLYFPAFGLNTEICSGNLRIQSEYRKIRTRNKSVFGHFSRSGVPTIFFRDFYFY